MTARSDIATRLRIISGLVLMAFATGHLINHALALISLDAVQAGASVFRAVWRSPPATILLYGALLLHIGFGLFKLYQRRSLRMPAWEFAQVLLGLAIPFWLAVHIIGTRGIHEIFGATDNYMMQFALIWPSGAGTMMLMLLLVWFHGCLGMHFWLRFRPWYPDFRQAFLVLALLVPGLALAGFNIGGREIQARMNADPAWLERVAERWDWPSEEILDWVYRQEELALAVFSGLIGLALLARLARRWFERSAGKVQIRYLDGAGISIEPGMTVLDGSRLAGIPHASVCGGRGRCSTCRVRLGSGREALPPPAGDEAKVLARINAGDGIRLACQIRPTRDLEVIPLLPAAAVPTSGVASVNPSAGVEREMVVLFADLRAFTRLAEGRLPFDVVFILNQYFKAMGAAIEGAGGRIDKFIGDGIMALFGIEADPTLAAKQALVAARGMSEELSHLNRQIQAELPEPLRIGIGLHLGPVILGEMGYKRATSLTAIGDTVNVASRLEALTKDFGAELVVSSALTSEAGVDVTAFETEQIDIRGRRRPLRVHIVPDAKTLPLPGYEERQPKPSIFSYIRHFRSKTPSQA